MKLGCGCGPDAPASGPEPQPASVQTRGAMRRSRSSVSRRERSVPTASSSYRRARQWGGRAQSAQCDCSSSGAVADGSNGLRYPQKVVRRSAATGLRAATLCARISASFHDRGGSGGTPTATKSSRIRSVEESICGDLPQVRSGRHHSDRAALATSSRSQAPASAAWP